MAAFSPGIEVGIEDDHVDAHKKMLIALIVSCTALAAGILSLLCLWIYRRKFSRKPHRRSARSSDAEKGLALPPFLTKFSSLTIVGTKGSVPLIDYKLLEKATDNFRDSNILGEGGFGCVYKAQLDDTLNVAVKKLNCESQDAEREFENEVNIHREDRERVWLRGMLREKIDSGGREGEGERERERECRRKKKRT